MSERRTFAVKAEGVGRKDYSVRVQEIRRGETLLQFKPRAVDELQEVFFLNFHPDEPLAVGAVEHLIVQATGERMPYTSEKGYLIEQRERLICFNGYVRLVLRLDDLDPILLYPRPDELTHVAESLTRLASRNWDPEGTKTHEWDFTIVNLDDISLQGMIQLSLILTKI